MNLNYNCRKLNFRKRSGVKILHDGKTIGAIFFALFLASCNPSVIYVSNNGNDSNTGSKSQPVSTLKTALKLAQTSKIKNIVLSEGDYYNVSVNLAEEDSGIHISGEAGKNVRLFGGIFIENWEKNGPRFEAQIPDSILPTLDFRILIVNDTLRQRARLPELGAFTHKNVWPHEWQSSQGGWSKVPTKDELTTLYYNPDDIGSWLDVKNAELTVFHAWDDSYVAISEIDTVKHILKFAHEATHPPGAFASWAGEKTHQYILWNIKEGMTKPGQWYVDRSKRKIVYWPFPYENASTLNVMVPTQNHLFRIEKNTSGITLENLQLSCVGAPISNTGYATYNIIGALVADQAKNLTLNNIQVKNVAGWALKLSGSNISIADCSISETGAGGIFFKGDHIRIERCGIHDLGKLYFGAVGIMGEGWNNLISHCELYNIPYCAINGLGKKSIAEYNLIYDFKQMMVDGGAIYIYGGDSTVYRNNAVFFKKGNKTEGLSYYFDELSVNCIMENNLAINTLVPVHHHMASDLTIRDNIFIDEEIQKISYPLCSNLSVTGNIFIAPQIRFSGPNGEIGPTKKESLNAVFQKYYDCNGIIKFEENQLFSDSVQHDVLHVYNNFRKGEFIPGMNQKRTDSDKSKAILEKLPELYSTTGYRKNFGEVLKQMTDITN